MLHPEQLWSKYACPIITWLTGLCAPMFAQSSHWLIDATNEKFDTWSKSFPNGRCWWRLSQVSGCGLCEVSGILTGVTGVRCWVIAEWGTFSVLSSWHSFRLLSACCAFVYTAHTKVVAHVKDPMSTQHCHGITQILYNSRRTIKTMIPIQKEETVTGQCIYRYIYNQGLF